MRKQLYGDNADERLVRRSWEGGEAASLVRRVAAASLPVELLAGPATLIGALCPHKVAHYHTATLSWTITLSQWIALSDYHKATLASPSHPDGGRQSRLRTSWTISSSTKNRPCKEFWIHNNVRQIHWLLLRGRVQIRAGHGVADYAVSCGYAHIKPICSHMFTQSASSVFGSL